MQSVLTYDPRWRSRSVSDKRTKDKYLREYKSYKKKKKPGVISDAEHIHYTYSMRVKMEVMLISCDFEIEEIAEYFGIPEEVVEYYEKIFFDVEAIKKSEVKKVELAEDCENEAEKYAKLGAIRYGRTFVNYMLGRDIDEPETDEFVYAAKKRLHDGLVIKSLGHEFLGSNSNDMSKYLKMMSQFNKMKTKEDKEDEDGLIGNLVRTVCDKFNEISEDYE